MGKRERHFDKIAGYKCRFRSLSTEAIRHRLNEFGTGLYKEARIALRQILEERRQQTEGTPAMNEAEWLACTDPLPMLDFLRDKATERKLRLFGLACCCRIVRLLTDQRSVNAVLVTDRYLEGTASREELNQAEMTARQAYENALQTHDNAAFAAVSLAVDDPYQAARSAAAHSAYAVAHELAGDQGSQAALHEKYVGGLASENKWQSAALRHIIGNPFHPYPVPDHWPSTVVQLAAAFTEGKDCGFALHDALLDAGHPELAAHFRQKEPHPKGCWVLDLVLGKP